MNTTTIDNATAAARALGADAGKSAASWAFDGNTSDDTYRAFIAGYDDGDPLIMEQFAPSSGWLSGEWADSETPNTLCARIGLDPWPIGADEGEALSELCDAYESAAEEAYWGELERVARYHTS